jgi:glycyl-tRNA synthetase
MTSTGDLIKKIESISKQRGFIFQSSDIYGGLRSAYDYGPMGVELKRNIMAEWWSEMIYKREDIYGLDASILMHRNVWKASGHLANFTDPIIDCLNCHANFRSDKQARRTPGEVVEYEKKQGSKKQTVKGTISPAFPFTCPYCNSVEFGGERRFNLMFRTSIGSVDTMDQFLREIAGKSLDYTDLQKKFQEVLEPSSIYLRPETAQAMFVQFANIWESQAKPKLPFGIAQMGKSFRNEITTEHFIFRSCEFEQMEMEYFVEPGTQQEWLNYWCEQRMKWWTSLANCPEKFRLREHAPDELAFYSDRCFDIEYEYPWGWDELEGIASRTNYDLTQHANASGSKNLKYFDPDKKGDERFYYPYVIEPAAGATRAVLVFLLDAYTEQKGVDKDGNEKIRCFLKLHPRLAPYKVAILPLTRKEPLTQLARKIVQQFLQEGIHAKYDETSQIGKRYARHDEIGNPLLSHHRS